MKFSRTCSLVLPTPAPCRRPWRRAGWCATLLVAGLLAGCAHAPLNTPLTRYKPTEGYRSGPLLDRSPEDELAVVLFFSGGGTRAAALSYGVLKELAHTDLPGGARMLDRVEAISAVSGGSVTAAYYCLYGDRVFQDFEMSFLKRDVQGEFFRSVGSPVNTVRLASARFARSDLAAEYYDRILFQGATFGDLLRTPGPRPFLMINATEMDNFAHFPFTQETFDLLGSDLSSYPISRAIAASSAIPLVMTPITLKNYADPSAIADPPRGYRDIGKRPYIHLLDGGLADNLGVSNLVAAVAAAGGWDALLRCSVEGKATHVALIIVNAATPTRAGWSQHPQTPSLAEVASALSKSTISHTNEILLDRVREGLDSWRHNLVPGEKRPQVHLINVDFSQLSDPAERSYFEHVPTKLNLPDEMVDRVVAIAGRLLREAPEFRTLLAELQTAPPSAPSSYPR